MRAEGYAVIGETRIEFSKEDTFATLDWGGVCGLTTIHGTGRVLRVCSENKIRI
jgi:hypothetical protein